MRRLLLLTLAACGGMPAPVGTVSIDGEARSLEDCLASACGDTACAQAEGRDDAAKAMSFEMSEGRFIVYPPVDGVGDVYYDGGCVETETVSGTDIYGNTTTTEQCIAWDRVLFEGCWSGAWVSERDGPGSAYHLVDATLNCELDGRSFTGDARCERGIGALAREHDL